MDGEIGMLLGGVAAADTLIARDAKERSSLGDSASEAVGPRPDNAADAGIGALVR
jgi:hypothetical protein